MNLDNYKNVALILLNKNDENDVTVYKGEIIFENETYYFINKIKQAKITLTQELFDSMQKTDPEISKMLLYADYFFTMYVNDLPDDFNKEEYILTNL
jgi:hypothetical protein